jgi:hypothetical protein
VTFQAATVGQFLAQVNVAYTQNAGYGSYPGSLTSNLIGLTGTPEGIFVLSQVAANQGLFGNVPVGTSLTHNFEFLSTGNIALSIASVAVTGTNANLFTVTANNCPALLQPSASCTISVTFAPTSPSPGSPQVPFTASINVIDNAPDTPQTAALSGIGAQGSLYIGETIHVSDTPVLTPSTPLPVNEIVHLSDAPVLIPSTPLPVNEIIHVSDATGLTPSTLLPINETIHVLDTPILPDKVGGGLDTVLLVASATAVNVGSNLTLTTMVKPSGSTVSPTGMVTLFDNGSVLTTVSLTSGVATYSTSSLAAGSHSLYAQYSGDSTYEPNNSNSLTVSETTNNILNVAAQNASRNFDTANPAFTYTVTGFVNGDTAAVLTGAPSFSTTAVLNSLAGGYAIVPSLGTLAGPSNYSYNFVNGALTVNGNAPQTIAFQSLPAVSLSLHPQITLTSQSTSGLTVTYSVTSGPATVHGSTLTLTGTGIVKVTASQSGNTTFAPAVSVAQSFTVTP